MKKGFTLMELLAVIVILAIISLIAIPIILNIIEASRKGAKETSALGYIDAVEKYIITSEVDSEKYPNKLESGKTYCLIENSTYKDKCPDTTIYLNDFIEVKGDKPIDGYVTINGKKNVSTSNLVISDYETICNDNKCKVKDKVKLSLCEYNVGETWDFNFTNGEENFVVPCNGTYKLETWGAQGGDATCNNLGALGGYGGYSTGEIKFKKEEQYFINVGGKGSTNTAANKNIAGGYNGGGSSTGCDGNGNYYGGRECQGSGGGATHIASKSGMLRDLKDYKDKILIVSGGGGGSAWYLAYDPFRFYGTGGSGGGATGTNSYNTYYGTNSYPLGIGGTQDKSVNPSNSSFNGGFGYGGGSTAQGAIGGGGGYYGGTATGMIAGGGGSGYIGNNSLTNKIMYCYKCTESELEDRKTRTTDNVSENPISNYAKINDGHARITLVKIG